MPKTPRGRALTVFAILFGLLAISDLLKPFQFGGQQTGFAGGVGFESMEFIVEAIPRNGSDGDHNSVMKSGTSWYIHICEYVSFRPRPSGRSHRKGGGNLTWTRQT